MRRSVLLAGLLALVAAGSASAVGGGGDSGFRVVKRSDGYAATADYRYSRGSFAVTHLTLRIRRGARIVLRHRICPQPSANSEACTWSGYAWYPFKPAGLPLEFRDTGQRTPALVLDLFTDYNAHCCVNSFIALLGRRPHWIVHDWGSAGYRGRRIHGRYYFVSGDKRFVEAYTTYVGSALPVRIWTIGKRGRLVVVTRRMPSLIRADARRLERLLRPALVGEGVLAAWCADEYLLDRGAACSRQLRYDLAHGYLNADQCCQMKGDTFIHALNRDLKRWGYKR